MKNKDEIHSALLLRISEFLLYLFPRGKITNKKFYLGNIRGDAGMSLSFELSGKKAGLWHDFETNEGGDLFDAWALHHNLDVKADFSEILEGISEWLGDPPAHTHNTHTQRTAAPLSSFSGKYSQKWDYCSGSGRLIACVYRYDTADGKSFRPWDVATGRYKSPDPRPLYNQPGLKSASHVVLVEGEKCADALIRAGICATTAMGGANAPLEKTDWSPLKGKQVIIWPDNDAAGKAYAGRVVKKLQTEGVASVSVLRIPEERPEKWDAADALTEGTDLHAFIKEKQEKASPVRPALQGLKFADFLKDERKMPDDVIAPRVLTPGGLLVFGGAPKVGKSDFVFSWMSHMAAGMPFLGMKPERPLRIFYFQSEIDYFYMRERVQKAAPDFSEKALEELGKNMAITPRFKTMFNEDGVRAACQSVREHFSKLPVDILVIDPLRNVFDGGRDNAGENDNMAMLFFLQERLEFLRKELNPDAGLILVHHTRKISRKDLIEDPFQALAGASSLRGYYSTGIVMYYPYEDQLCRKLAFELRNGPKMPDKIIDKIDDTHWVETPQEEGRIVGQAHGERLDAERDRKNHVILQTIYDEALEGRVYTAGQFAEEFEKNGGLGSEKTIRRRISVLLTKGELKVFKNWEKYKLPPLPGKAYGFLCVDGMQLKTGENVMRVYPTHFKHSGSGIFMPVENPHIWVSQI